MKCLSCACSGVGPLTHPGCEVVGLINSKSLASGDQPDLQFMLLPGGLSSDAGVVLKPAMGISDQVHESSYTILWWAEFLKYAFLPLCALRSFQF